MKTRKVPVVAQGELTIRRLGDLSFKLPEGCSPLKADGDRFIVGHSETGHHHVIDARGASVAVLDRPPEGMRILYAILENPTSLDHLRPHDTHESIALEPGVHEIRIAREFDHYAELARKSMD
jgi:hypothetical protein